MSNGNEGLAGSVRRYRSLSEEQKRRRERLRGLVDKVGADHALSKGDTNALYDRLAEIPPGIEGEQKAKLARRCGLIPRGVPNWRRTGLRGCAISAYAVRNFTWKDLLQGKTIPDVEEKDLLPKDRKAALRAGNGWFPHLNERPGMQGRGRPEDRSFHCAVEILSRIIADALGVERVTFTRNPYGDGHAEGPVFELLCTTLELWFFARPVSRETVASLLQEIKSR